MAEKKFIEPNNLYYQIRTAKGLSRDKACDLFERISPDRLERIENGKVLPNPEEIMEMADCYREPEIRNYYCSHQCPMGKHFVSEIRSLDLSQAALQILAQMNRLNDYKDKIIDIASDGKVMEEEQESFKRIIDELEKLSRAIDSLMLWADKESLR